MVMDEARALLVLCAIREDKSSLDWSLIARECLGQESTKSLYEGTIVEKSKAADLARPILRRSLEQLDDARRRVDSELDIAEQLGARLVTVLDDDYPSNLRLIWNLPPFLFVLGETDDRDIRSVAVVGTRNASDAGIRRADRMASLLVANGVTVVSGLAKGIDTAAHTAALDAGGRTVAVVGTGVATTYPAANRSLAERIVEGGGAIVSQFWPSSGPARWTFPRRNVVMSGIAQGTVVIEATGTSGAKMQARLALEHGKRVFLIQSLVADQEWAQNYVDKRGAILVEDVDDVVERLADPERVTRVARQRQLTLDLM